MTDLMQAAASVDWLQVVLNGGPPCFHVEDGCFCLRARSWGGHPGCHPYVDLAELVGQPEIPCCPPHEEMYRKGTTQPLDNCFVCIRNERDELKERLVKRKMVQMKQRARIAACLKGEVFSQNQWTKGYCAGVVAALTAFDDAARAALEE